MQPIGYIEGGYSCMYWWNVFLGCHSKIGDDFVRIEWPTGGHYIEQEYLLTSMFALILDEWGRHVKQDRIRNRWR